MTRVCFLKLSSAFLAAFMTSALHKLCGNLTRRRRLLTTTEIYSNVWGLGYHNYLNGTWSFIRLHPLTHWTFYFRIMPQNRRKYSYCCYWQSANTPSDIIRWFHVFDIAAKKSLVHSLTRRRRVITERVITEDFSMSLLPIRCKADKHDKGTDRGCHKVT